MHVDAKYHLAGFLICLFFCIGSKEVACIKTQLMLWFLIYFTVLEKCTSSSENILLYQILVVMEKKGRGLSRTTYFTCVMMHVSLT